MSDTRFASFATCAISQDTNTKLQASAVTNMLTRIVIAQLLKKWAYAHLLIKKSEMLERDSEKKTKNPQISPKLELITFFLENDSFENCARQLRAHKKP